MTERFGQFRLQERIAAGGMGEVFLAKFTREGGFEKTVAVKRMLPALSSKPGFEARFCAEARLAARLNHNNIVQVYDFGNLGGALFLAMEFVEGVDLGTLLLRLGEKDERLLLALSLRIIADALKGLDYAHRLKDGQGRELHLIHRDISPSNILISFEGEVKLTDFGLASVKDDQSSEDDRLAGKYSYLQPEQIKNEPLDRRSDLYSMGLVLYEMVYGRQTFPGQIPPEALMRGIAAGAIDFPPDPAVPDQVVDILKTSCAIERCDRFNTAREMLRAVGAEIDRLKPSPGEELPKLLGRLFPDRQQSRSVAPERTVLSTSPIAPAESAPTPPVDRAGARLERPPFSRRRLLLIGVLVFLLISVVAIRLPDWMPGRGVLKIVSTPSEAEIWLDGEATNRRTPAAFDGLDVDREHRVKLILPYFDPWEDTLSLREDAPAELAPELERSLQVCRIETEPPGARVWSNGELLDGLTPVYMGELPLGEKQRLRIEKDGFVSFETEFIIEGKEGGEKIFFYSLQSIYKEILIEVEPASAMLFVDGRRRTGRSPFKLEDLISGRSLDLVASLEGYRSETAEIIPGRDTGPVKMVLKPFKSDLIVETPEGASVLVNGKKVEGRARINNAHLKVQLVSISPPSRDGRVVIRVQIGQVRDAKGRLVAQATLNLDAQPWASISLDNGSAFTTPSSGQTIRCGKHRLSVTFGHSNEKLTLYLQLI